ncbi:leucine-rich repeat- and IQ domain-containing protein 1 [Discoglossus pictus]
MGAGEERLGSGCEEDAFTVEEAELGTRAQRMASAVTCWIALWFAPIFSSLARLESFVGSMEEEIELELSRIPALSDVGDQSSEDEECESSEDTDDGEVIDELPESVLSCLKFVTGRCEDSEKLILQDLESNDTWISPCYTVKKHTSDFLAELAFEYNEEPEALKNRILADIEEDDKKENNHGNRITSGNMLADVFGSGDMIINLDYIEVEETCRQKLLELEDKQEKQSEEIKKKLGVQREVLQKETQEQDERIEKWKKDLEKESSILNTINKEQQEKLDEEVKKNNEAFAEDKKKHEDLIRQLEIDLEKERKLFEEQKEKAKKELEDLQDKSAIKIQAKFRAFQIYKYYAPILKEKKGELKKKKEQQLKMEQEKKELEEKIKHKLEERKRKDEEKRDKEECDRRKREEAEKHEHLKQEMRQREYEKKKEEAKQRLEKARVLKQESTEKPMEEKLDKINSALQSNNIKDTNGKKSDKEVHKQNHVPVEPEKNNKMVEELKTESLTIRGDPIKHKEIKMEMNLVSNQIQTESDKMSEININVSNNITVNNGADIKVMLAPDLECKEKRRILVATTFFEPVRIVDQCVEDSIPDPDKSNIQECNLPSSSYNEGADSPLSQGTKSPQKETTQNEQSNVPELICATFSVLPDYIEERRLTWMKTCKPWSEILRGNQKNHVVKKTRQRKSSAVRKLPPLDENIILQNSLWQNLRQVTTVILQDLPGCSLSTLSECRKLKYLSMRCCSLTSLEGINSCKDLRYIDVQENDIQVINCEDLENLCVLLLNKNRISSIHGLENCTNLRNLELSFNSITRLGGLESLKNLQRLVLDHNQLISTKGLEAAPMIMYLDCSYNHLSELEGIQNCVLLQILKLQGNNLSKVPNLDNHVLLREVYLDDNSISTMEGFSSYWLPLLQVLSFSQNSLTRISSLSTFISLEDLDISSNCLSDLQSIVQGLNGCINLRRLLLSRNPLLQESNWRCMVLKILPSLRSLNSELILPGNGHCKEDTHKPAKGSFLKFCKEQLQAIHKKWHPLNTEDGTCSSLDAVEIICRCFKELMKVSNEHRYAHEYGDMEVNEREDPEMLAINVEQPAMNSHQLNDPVINGANENKQNDPSTQIASKRATSMNAKTSKCSLSVKNKEHSAATIIQSHWRGYTIRRDILYYARLHEAASAIQSFWRSYCNRKTSLQKKNKPNLVVSKIRNQAATVIQAAWKGFHLRKKLAAALASIERDELEDDFEEVNLDDFLFNEALGKEWSLDPPKSPSKTHFSSKPEEPKLYKNIYAAEDNAGSLLHLPQQAWPSCDTAGTDSICVFERLHVDSRLEKHDLSHVSITKSNIDTSLMSEKEEQISQEWGFKDASTAQLMLKRAQKMKSKQAKNKKMFDPAVRLALFKNNENKHLPMKPPKKVQPAKIDYFQGSEDQFYHVQEVPSEAVTRSKALAYEWLHTQCGDVELTSSRIMKPKRFLPELNPDVLNGGRVQLVTNVVNKEATDLEVVSVTSGSAISHIKERSKEAKGHSREPSNSSPLTPLRANSGPAKKDRISFRDNPVQLSGGWGSGKKRGKLFK